MSIEKLRNHYAMTSPASVYDEEALTALELAGRTACKVNEVIDQSNQTEARTESMVERLETVERDMPVMAREAAEKQVDAYVKDGTFDAAIDEYAGDLEKRLDNFMKQTPNGSTTMDAEIIDARVGGNGKTYDNLGDATRDQYAEVNNAANDRVSARAMEYGYKRDYNRPSLWRQGWIDTATGEDGDTGTDVGMYIRTAGFVPATVERAEVVGGDKGLRLSVYVYDLSGRFVRLEEYRRAAYKFDHTANKYRLAATGGVDQLSNVYLDRKMPVTVADSASILMLGDPDDTARRVVSPDALAHGYNVDLNARHLWEQGYLFGNNGEEGTSPAGADYWSYARTGFLPEGSYRLFVKNGYKARVFMYYTFANNVTFQSMTEVTGLQAQGFGVVTGMIGYRIDVTPIEKNLNTRAYVGDLWDKVILLSEPVATSGDSADFLTRAVYAPVPSGRYKCSNPDTTFTTDTNVQTATGAFTMGMMMFGHVVTRESFGHSVNGAYIEAYRYKPVAVDGSVVDPLPKIIIVGGQHGFEKGATFGMTNFFTNLVGNEDDPVLDYLRTNVEYVFIPVLNPDGFESNQYKNANGVNLNRNYDFNWTAVADATSDQFGGNAPFDQPETAALRDFIQMEMTYGNLALVIDFHAKGHYVESTRDLNWIACPNETDANYARLRRVCRNHLAEQGTAFRREMPLTTSATVGYYEGFTGGGNTTPSLDNWLVYNNRVVSLTLECFNYATGVSDAVADVASAAKYNAEILGNFILHFLREYSREV